MEIIKTSVKFAGWIGDSLVNIVISSLIPLVAFMNHMTYFKIKYLTEQGIIHHNRDNI